MTPARRMDLKIHPRLALDERGRRPADLWLLATTLLAGLDLARRINLPDRYDARPHALGNIAL